MVVWSEKLYIGEQAEKNHRKIRRKLESGKAVMDYYLITR